MDEVIAECRALSGIGSVAEALVLYAKSLGAKVFRKRGNRFVAEPNFVTFEVHSQRTNNLTISLRGNPTEFLELVDLPVKKSQNGYSEVKVTSAAQLLAAASYIARAREVFDRGRTRVQRTPKVVEI